MPEATAVPVTARNTVSWPTMIPGEPAPGIRLELKVPTLLERETLYPTLLAHGCVNVSQAQIRAALLNAVHETCGDEAAEIDAFLRTYWTKDDALIGLVDEIEDPEALAEAAALHGPTPAEQTRLQTITAQLQLNSTALQRLLAAAVSYERKASYLMVAIGLVGWTGIDAELVRADNMASDASMQALYEAIGPEKWEELKVFVDRQYSLAASTEKNSVSPALKSKVPTSSPTATSGSTTASATKKTRSTRSRRTAAR